MSFMRSHIASSVTGVPLELRDLALPLASGTRYVQGAGGNISIKQDDVLWVKASGTRFADAALRSIFVPLDLRAARAGALVAADLRSAVISVPETDGLRPSIEAAFHALMPQRVVVHVHSVGAVAAGVGDGLGAQSALSSTVPLDLVPYRRPGRELAQELVESGVAVERREAAALLLNHGLLVAAQTAQRALDLVREIEGVLAPRDLPQPEADPVAVDGMRFLFGPGTLDAAARAVLMSGVLTPDSAVYLGPRPFGATGTGASCVLLEDGAVGVSAALSADACQVVESLVAVALEARQPIRCLPEDEVSALVGWEAEQWRRAQQR